jgi:hypothetical protein
MEIKLTTVFRKIPQGYVAFVQELPGANSQCATLEEARENLKEAVAMVFTGKSRFGRRVVAWGGCRARAGRAHDRMKRRALLPTS